ncbi:PREDICTED: putative disease resistance protein RGA3 [Erythranthe guttata]|uniref:putative disease resistance protein RGA3 n=1 Tax=Erythranthe guttata TaxID=4155 RepID=UPI00064D90FC|nr:PREDICTED: putative disease resistance protein RGA3 [Erythranthe guttata]|eukprot:XP_012843384.1 PREDICTED: putative disease resistance protein RGA3 [Erythranthe guttata]
MAAEAAGGAAIQFLLEKLISVSGEQISLYRDFKKDLKRLKSSISMIQSFLNDAEKKQITDETVERWLRKLEGVAFDADNVFDELHYQHLSKEIQKHDKMKKKNKCHFLIFPQCIPNTRRLKMARKINDIIQNFEEINKEATDYDLQKAVVGAYAPLTGSSVGLETDSFSIDPIFLGRENDVSEIVKMMTTLPNDQVLSILPICGMGGLGKTTVAQNVFDHEAIKIHFAKCFWVHVSQNFDGKILFNKILILLTGTNAGLGDKQPVLEKLQKELGAQRFLLVLDDVWNENPEIWDDFSNSLRKISSATGNGVVVTTRSENVASLVTTLPTMHKLKHLPEGECWSIIKAKSFGEGSVPLEYETVGVSIANRCQGLPLAAKVVGGLLRGKLIDEWQSIDEKWLSYSRDENPVSKILKLSFDYLSPPSLKKCFAYCSIFPKGYGFERKRLVELWMAEGFLGGSDDMEIVGNKFFNLLSQNSLLHNVERSMYYNMHDLVHDLASSILNPKTDNISDEAYQVRYISLQSTDAETSHILKEHARYLRTLHFECDVLNIMFSDFKCLHALIIVKDGVESNDEDLELPSSIGELIHLRCLDISGTTIKCLPDSVGELYHLQTLRACGALEKLPNTLKHLISLRHLHIPRIELFSEMGRLTSLRTLPYFGVGDENGRGIGELGSLKNLEGKLEIYNLENVHDKEEAMSADLLRKPDIVKLNLTWDEDREGGNGDESVLEGLQPHPNLESLNICGFGGRSLPSWCLNMSGLNKLMEITLDRCKECEQVPMLGHLPHLKNLYLDGLVNVRSIGSSFYGIDDKCVSKNTLINVFPALERLELRGMSELTEWLEAELPSATLENEQLPTVFSRLEYLRIKDCRQFKSAPSHFPCLKELLIGDVESELPLASLCGINLISLTKLRIESIDGLTCLPDWLFRKNQNLSKLEISGCRNLTHLVPCLEGGGTALRTLEIYNCPKLRELPDDLHTLSALEILRIEDCPNLKTIPYPHETHNNDYDEQLLLGLSSLSELVIVDCGGLTNLPSEMIESCAQSLESLTLTGLINLRMNMGTLIGYCLQKMPRLSTLSIVDVPVTNNSSEIVGFFSLNNLTYLAMSCDKYSISCVADLLPS